MHGSLQFFEGYIRRYNEIMAPIIALLAATPDPWTAMHTATVRAVLVELV